MDFSFLSSMFGGGGSGAGGGALPASGGYYFGDTPVRAGVATGGGLAAGTAMPGGAVAGGSYPSAGSTPASMGQTMPAGGTAEAIQPPATKNSMSGAGGVGGGLADSLKAIGDMISNYQTASAYGKEEAIPQTPTMRIQPALATFTVPTVGR